MVVPAHQVPRLEFHVAGRRRHRQRRIAFVQDDVELILAAHRPVFARQMVDEPIGGAGAIARPAHAVHLVDQPPAGVGQLDAVKMKANAVELGCIADSNAQQDFVNAPDGIPAWQVITDRQVDLSWLTHLQFSGQFHGRAGFGLGLRIAPGPGGHVVEFVLGRHDFRMGQFAQSLVETGLVGPQVEPVGEIQTIDALSPVVGGTGAGHRDRSFAEPVGVHV